MQAPCSPFITMSIFRGVSTSLSVSSNLDLYALTTKKRDSWSIQVEDPSYTTDLVNHAFKVDRDMQELTDFEPIQHMNSGF